MRNFAEISADIASRNDMDLIRLSDSRIIFSHQYVSPRGARRLKIAASVRSMWDHVAISCNSGLPSTSQVNCVRKFVMDEGEWMMQLHVPTDLLESGEETALHLWRPHHLDIPLPPPRLVRA